MNNFKDKKFALIFGQAIEGCGVTRTGVEMQYWCKKNGVNLKIFSYDERSYNRKTAHNIEYTSFTRENIDETAKELNTYDVVMFNSYPSAKFEKQAIIDFYNKIVKLKNPIKIGFMHELNKTNIDKIPFLMGIMNEMDLIYNFAETTWFSQTISKMLPSKKLSERTKKFTMWFNFDELNTLKEKYKDYDKEKKLMYIGRWTTMKDPRRVLDLGQDLYKNGIATELKGIERSIGAKFDIFEHENCIDCTGKEMKKISESAVTPVYGPYIRNEGMEDLAKTMFGCSFYRMPKAPQDYGDRMEYTQIEIIATGVIPVFDKHWGENNRTKDGRRYIDIPYSAVYSDKDNLAETVEHLTKISKDKDLQKKYIETSFEIAKNEFDANLVLPEMFNHMLKVGKDENKYKSEKAMMQELIDPDFYRNFADLFDEYSNKDEIPVLGIRELSNNIFSILDGKKEKEIKHFKKSKLKKNK